MALRLPANLSSPLPGACSVAGLRGGAGDPRCDLVGRIGEVEIRRHAPRIAAGTPAAGTEEAARDEGFRRNPPVGFDDVAPARGAVFRCAPAAREPA